MRRGTCRSFIPAAPIFELLPYAIHVPETHHQNIVDICEVYFFENQIFAIFEYLDFSLADLQLHDFYSTETEISFTISQIRQMVSLVKGCTDGDRYWLVYGPSGQGNLITYLLP